jgi:Protein of unknown function (DUF4239)
LQVYSCASSVPRSHRAANSRALHTFRVRKAHNDTIGILYGTLHVTFGVIVDFTAFLVLGKYNTSQNTVASEAGDIVEIYQLANFFPEAQRDQIQELARSYAQEVVEEEWPLMRNGQSSSRAEGLVNEIEGSIQDFEPSTDSERAAYAQELTGVHNLTQDRNVRLLNLYMGLPRILWVVLGGLATLIILFSYFLGLENAWLHRWAVGIEALLNPISELLSAIVYVLIFLSGIYWILRITMLKSWGGGFSRRRRRR